jgi:hypothetical protein
MIGKIVLWDFRNEREVSSLSLVRAALFISVFKKNYEQLEGLNKN